MPRRFNMLRSAFLAAVAAVAVTGPLRSQAHTHHHPRGAKIVMIGTVVDPVCSFAQQLPDSARAGCSHQHQANAHPPVLLADGELYVLAFEGARGHITSADGLLGRRVKVDGTVYPAGSSYLIVVDSLRAAPR